MVSSRWQCPSTKPGTAVRPSRSIRSRVGREIPLQVGGRPHRGDPAAAGHQRLGHRVAVVHGQDPAAHQGHDVVIGKGHRRNPTGEWTGMLASAIVRVRSFHTRNGTIRTMATRTKTKSDLAAELGSALFRIAKLRQAVGASRARRARADGAAGDGAAHTWPPPAARCRARELGRECDMLASTATGRGRPPRAARLRAPRARRSRPPRRVGAADRRGRGSCRRQLPAFQPRLGRTFTVLPAARPGAAAGARSDGWRRPSRRRAADASDHRGKPQVVDAWRRCASRCSW